VNWTLTSRDKVILSLFTLVLVGVMWGIVRWATAPAQRGRAIQTTASKTLERISELSETAKSMPVRDVPYSPMAFEGESPANLPRRDYRYIAERNIFQPPSETPSSKKEQTSQRTNERVTRSQTSPGGLSAPPPLPPAPPPPPSTSFASTQMTSRPANLTATGLARIGDETYVLLEDLQTRNVAFVKVGESAFGYQVTNVGENYVEIKQGDIAYRIVLGEGKQERKILASASSVTPRPTTAGPTVGQFGGPPGTFGQGQTEQRSGRGSSEWVSRMMDRWNQLPEFVRDRILQRVGEFWQQLPPDQQQQILQRFRQMGVNFNPPGR